MSGADAAAAAAAAWGVCRVRQLRTFPLRTNQPALVLSPATHSLAGRRLQNLGGIVHKKGLIPAPLPSWLQPLLGRLAQDTGAYGEGQAPNHVLINAYQPGEGIMPHEASAAAVCWGCVGCRHDVLCTSSCCLAPQVAHRFPELC